MLKDLRIVYIVSRPRFWIYEAGTFLVGAIAAFSAGIDISSPAFIVFLIYFLFPANVLIYGINDIFDYETDIKNPKKQGYEFLVTPKEHPMLWSWIAALNIPFLIVGFFLLPSIAFVWLLLFVFFAVFYSATPIRAKARPGLDSFFSASHYVATGVVGYHAVGGTDLPIIPILGGLAWAIAMHAFSAVPDIEADKASGVPTIATYLGKTATISICIVLYAISGFIASLYIGILGIFLAIAYVIVMFTAIATRNDDQLFKLYKLFPALNTLVGGIVFVVLLLERLSS